IEFDICGCLLSSSVRCSASNETFLLSDSHAYPRHYTADRGFAFSTPRRGGLPPMGTTGSPRTAAESSGFRQNYGFPRVSVMSSFHPLDQFLFHHPSHPQWPANFCGPSSALLECSLHSRHRVASVHTGRGAERSRLDRQGRLAVSFSVDRPAGLPAYRWHGATLAFS